MTTNLLHSYRVLNHTGFIKISKKIEKETRIPCLVAFTKAVDATNFVASKTLDELLASVEKGYTESFSHGDRKVALENLRNSGGSQQHHYATFKSGVYLGVALTLILDGLIKSESSQTDAVTR